MKFKFTRGLSGLNLYKQYIAVITKREVIVIITQNYQIEVIKHVLGVV